MNVYPAEIEAVLERHPGIFHGAVFGIPSEEWGELKHATVVLAPGAALSAPDVTAYTRAPGELQSEFTGELPPTGSGKILKRELRAPFWASQPGQLG